ncbi:MAG: hypothetical protein P1U34_10500 [Coxiellaceae bacterium]|nr:hypothetical protein [Coxiellaceae bacterium]
MRIRRERTDAEKYQAQQQIKRYQALVEDTDKMTLRVLQHAKDNTMVGSRAGLLLARLPHYCKGIEALVADAKTAAEKQVFRQGLQQQQQLWMTISVLQPAVFEMAYLADVLRPKAIGPVGVALPADYRGALDEAVATEAKDSDGAMFLSLPTPSMQHASITTGANDRMIRMAEGMTRGLRGMQAESCFQVVKPRDDARMQAVELLVLSHESADLARLESTAQLSGAIGAAYAVNNKLQINLESYHAVLDAMANTHAVTDAVLSAPVAQASAVAMQSFTAHPVHAVAEGESRVRLPNVILAEAVHRARQGLKVLLVDTDQTSGEALQQGLRNLLHRLQMSDIAEQRTLADTLEANMRFIVMPAVESAPTAKGVNVVLSEALDKLRSSGFAPALSLCSYQMAVPYARKDFNDLLTQLPGKLVVVPQGGNRRSDIINAMSAAVRVCQKRSSAAMVMAGERTSASGLVAMSVLTTARHVAEAGIVAQDPVPEAGFNTLAP